MPHVLAGCRIGIAEFLLVGFVCCTGRAVAQDAVALVEGFKPGHAYRVEVQVKLDGKLAVPKAKGVVPEVTLIAGTSRLTYDERILETDEPSTQKSVRTYRNVDFKRILGLETQDAGIRPSVRRMVMIRSGDRRAPFSPDGPLTWDEIDLVRSDVFNPVAVLGLLPVGAVKPGQTWKATDSAVAELTDLEKVDEGGLTVEFLGVTTVNGKRMAKLRVTGTVRGVNQDGPSRQKLDGTVFFDLGAGLLTYLSIRGTQELLDGATGQTVGVIEGQFVMTRSSLEQLPADLSDASLRGLSLKPDPENTLLLYDNAALGVRFLYPRGWRVGAVQGRQVTLDHAQLGGGILITLAVAGKVPTADDYLRETTTFLQKEKALVNVVTKPVRVRPDPIQLDRFALDVTFEKDASRMEYAVITQTDGGATVAARLPAATAGELRTDAERVIRSMSITKRIEDK